jgi:hypothetical protein
MMSMIRFLSKADNDDRFSVPELGRKEKLKVKIIIKLNAFRYNI